MTSKGKKVTVLDVYVYELGYEAGERAMLNKILRSKEIPERDREYIRFRFSPSKPNKKKNK